MTSRVDYWRSLVAIRKNVVCDLDRIISDVEDEIAADAVRQEPVHVEWSGLGALDEVYNRRSD